MCIRDRSQGNAPPIESLRSFRNVLQASLRQSANNMVMFTGPVAGVGKSFLSANFAFIQGGVGKRVLLIDADFRKGQLNRYFGVPKEDGLFEVLSGTLPLERVRKHRVSEGVDFIATGAVSFDPSELLASPIFGQTPVSYTHLDVYKRQMCGKSREWGWPMSRRPMGRMPAQIF